MGVLASGSAHASPSAQPPIDTSRYLNLKHFPINFLAISGDSKHFLFFPEKKPYKDQIGLPDNPPTTTPLNVNI